MVVNPRSAGADDVLAVLRFGGKRVDLEFIHQNLNRISFAVVELPPPTPPLESRIMIQEFTTWLPSSALSQSC